MLTITEKMNQKLPLIRSALLYSSEDLLFCSNDSDEDSTAFRKVGGKDFFKEKSVSI
jgi:hypothetical protein